MQLKKAKAETVEIADVQASPDTRRLQIDKVGIKDIRHPVLVKDRSQGVQHTIANFNMYVELPHNFKGTHMSRFVEILNADDMEISVDSFAAVHLTTPLRSGDTLSPALLCCGRLSLRLGWR